MEYTIKPNERPTSCPQCGRVLKEEDIHGPYSRTIFLTSKSYTEFMTWCGSEQRGTVGGCGSNHIVVKAGEAFNPTFPKCHAVGKSQQANGVNDIVPAHQDTGANIGISSVQNSVNGRLLRDRPPQAQTGLYAAAHVGASAGSEGGFGNGRRGRLMPYKDESRRRDYQRRLMFVKRRGSNIPIGSNIDVDRGLTSVVGSNKPANVSHTTKGLPVWYLTHVILPEGQHSGDEIEAVRGLSCVKTLIALKRLIDVTGMKAAIISLSQAQHLMKSS